MIEQVKQILEEWISQQGHNQCWYYPELFRRLCTLLDVKFVEPNLPNRRQFEIGCLKFQNEVFTRIENMEYIALAGLIAKGAIEILTMVQNLQEQHNQGTAITEEQAQALRDKVKANQQLAEQAWEQA
jgi:outer membrane protein assembly factor BamE (lipoprotein component of BamABCDE complex)